MNTIINIEEQAKNMGLILPVTTKPIGSYKAIITSGNLAFISGQLPLYNGELKYKGKIGIELSIEEGYKAAELCALNTLSHINKIKNFNRILKIDGYINCSKNFTMHARVLDGASDLFSSILGVQSGHTRSVLGCNSLPLGSAVEIMVTVELK
jgi:enamine deaminase RidA (YjgF/YER057c/UK114 family)